MAQHTIIENIHRNTEDWFAVKAAVRGKGVDCPDNTPTAQVAEKIESIDTTQRVTFNNSAQITSVILPESTTEIANRAFENCIYLAEIEIPNTVTIMYNDAFKGCHNLREINLPSALTSMGSGVFADCTALTSINIPDSVGGIGGTLDDKGGAFENCGSLKAVKFPVNNSFETIGYRMFKSCSSLVSIVIPNSVHFIDSMAFEDCSLLKSIYFPEGIVQFGENVFTGCTALTDIYYSGTQSRWESIPGLSGADIPVTATIHYNYTGDGSEL